MYRFLTKHPQVAKPSMKEPRFFTQNWKRGWDWYASIYEDLAPGQIAGDFSPSNSNMSNSDRPARRIAKFYPDAKIIYLVRNPIDCALSNWRMSAQNDAAPPFAECIGKHTAVYHRSLFWKQISYYRTYFPDDQILVMPLEVLAKAPDEAQRVTDFLGIEPSKHAFPHGNKSSAKINRPGKPDVDKAARKRFLRHIKPDAESILEYAGFPGLWDLSPSYQGWGAKVDQFAPV